jgi:hypothetical protein
MTTRPIWIGPPEAGVRSGLLVTYSAWSNSKITPREKPRASKSASLAPFGVAARSSSTRRPSSVIVSKLGCAAGLFQIASPQEHDLFYQQVAQVRHDCAAHPRDAVLVLLRTIGGAFMQPVGQPVGGPQLLEQARDVVAALPTACRALDPQHVELADQSADRSV